MDMTSAGKVTLGQHLGGTVGGVQHSIIDVLNHGPGLPTAHEAGVSQTVTF